MTTDPTELESEFRRDLNFGFLDASLPGGQRFQPSLISNDEFGTMEQTIKQELETANKFTFSVAFITTSALARMKQSLLDFAGSGTFITSDYLGFNSPDAFWEILELENIETRIYPRELGSFHSKGYVFEKTDSISAIVGSSNFTNGALVKNHEWNFRFSTLPQGDIAAQFERVISDQIKVSRPLTGEWIKEYSKVYDYQRKIRNTATLSPPSRTTFIEPNSMQVVALEAIRRVRESGKERDLVISATGTGKTILSALDVRNANPDRVLFLAHREQILEGAKQAFMDVLQARSDDFGKFVGEQKNLDEKYIFATYQSLSRPENLEKIPPNQFDYVLIDEVHRAGAPSYQQIINHLRPKFLLGLTATPERNDVFNIFELFDYNVPYEIRLQDAMDADMLVPFHYFGITDYIDANGNSIDDLTDLKLLVSSERVSHLIKAINQYGHKAQTRGLVFCKNVEEAHDLSRELNNQIVNGKLLRTRALTGTDSIDHRKMAVELLEQGDLDYILTVDIFNEGIDIPTLNQIILLRNTQSSIIFTQQLGRGLRKAEGKDHLRVIDFIGNYSNNYLIPLALTGDHSLNKEYVRKKLLTLSGLSSINFDKISRKRVLDALASAPLDSLQNLREAYVQTKKRIGHVPSLMDFAQLDTADPVVMATARTSNYWLFLNKTGDLDLAPTSNESGILNFLSNELLNGKRPQELLLLRALFQTQTISRDEYAALLVLEKCRNNDETIDSVLRVMNLDFYTSKEKDKYGNIPLIEYNQEQINLSRTVADLLEASEIFAAQFKDLIETGLYIAKRKNTWSGELLRGATYSRKDACRLLNWKSNEYSTIYGYKVDKSSKTCPIFVTYHKQDDIAKTTKYEDVFVDTTILHWFSRSKRTLNSQEVKDIIGSEYKLHIFVKKDDADGKDFYYLGGAQPYNPVQSLMLDDHGRAQNVVEIDLHLNTAVEQELYQYLTHK